MLAVLASVTYLVPSSPVAFPLSLDVQIDPVGDGRLLAATGERAADLRVAVGQLTLRRLPPLDALVAVLLWMLFWGLALPVVLHLRRVFAALQRGNLFGRDTVAALRRLGIALMVAFAGRTVLLLAGSVYALRYFASEGAALYPPTVQLSGILVGLVVIVAAEVLRQAADLQDEQALTI